MGKKHCITESMPPKSYFYNPLIAKFGETSREYSTCLLDKDEKRKDIFKICDKHIEYTPILKNTINSFFFLKYIYNFGTYTDVVNWLNNNDNISYHTVIRILNCSWVSFYDDMILNFSDTLELYKMIIDRYMKHQLDKEIFTNKKKYNIIIDKTIKKIAKKAKKNNNYSNIHDDFNDILTKYNNKLNNSS
jgi:hypothetical protein